MKTATSAVKITQGACELAVEGDDRRTVARQLRGGAQGTRRRNPERLGQTELARPGHAALPMTNVAGCHCLPSS